MVRGKLYIYISRIINNDKLVFRYVSGGYSGSCGEWQDLCVEFASPESKTVAIVRSEALRCSSRTTELGKIAFEEDSQRRTL